MNKICVSLKELYKANGARLYYGGYIDFYDDGESEYYDLRTTPLDSSGNEIICSDGEECEVISNDGEIVLLSNLTTGRKLYLTIDEYNIAVFE